MSTTISGRELKVVKGTASPDTTAQTPGMIRRPGIDSNTAGAKKIWLGHVECVPNTMGPPHNHGEAETAAYILKGHIRVYHNFVFPLQVALVSQRATASKANPTHGFGKEKTRLIPRCFLVRITSL